MLQAVDNQPITSRFGEAVWLTDFITPRNPDVQLRFREVTAASQSRERAMYALWQYVARLPYREAIPARLTAGKISAHQNDTWFYPAETMQVKTSNCANKAFLMASLLKNIYPESGNVFVVLGKLKVGEIGGHAWIKVDVYGKPYFIETTQPNLQSCFIPLEKAESYIPYLYFDENQVYATNAPITVAEALALHYGICAQPILEDYVCQRCLVL